MNKSMAGVYVLAASFFSSGVATAGMLDDIGQGVSKMANKGQKSPVLYLAAGIKVNLDETEGGRVVEIFGEDKCRQHWVDKLRGSPAVSGCIALDKPTVRVHFGHETELWTVKKDGERISLVRPNGVLVSQAR